MDDEITLPELQRKHEAALDKFRSAQNAFELCRANLSGARTRVNRLRKLAADNDAAAEAAREACRLALQASDGELTDAIKTKRRELRDAKDMAEDYAELAISAEAKLSELEVPALSAAKAMNDARISALDTLAELELWRAVNGSLPQFARAFHLYNALALPEVGTNRHTRGLIDSIDIIMPELRRALLRVEYEDVALPEDLTHPGDIAPLRWAEAISPIHISKRMREAGISRAKVKPSHGEGGDAIADAQMQAAQRDAAQLARDTGLTDLQAEAAANARKELQATKDGIQRQIDASKAAAHAVADKLAKRK